MSRDLIVHLDGLNVPITLADTNEDDAAKFMAQYSRYLGGEPQKSRKFSFRIGNDETRMVVIVLDMSRIVAVALDSLHATGERRDREENPESGE